MSNYSGDVADVLSTPSREFRMRAEYRRCAWYVLVGVILSIGLAALLKHQGLVPRQGSWISFAIGSIFFLLPAIWLLIAVHRWRLRVDENGIARRRLWKWDLWSWEEFESGEIRRRLYTFESTRRPLWRRSLSFDLLNTDDRRFVLGVCNHFYRPPIEPDSPLGQTVSLKYQIFWTVTFSETGVAGINSKGKYDLSWSDIQIVRLIYFAHEISELHKIELATPGRNIIIFGAIRITTAEGTRGVPEPKVIPRHVEQFLLRHVPRDKLLKCAISGPPTSLAEYHYRTDQLQRRLRNSTLAYRLIPTVVLVLHMIAFGPKIIAFWRVGGNLLNAGWIALVLALLVLYISAQPLMFWALLREIRNKLQATSDELEAWNSAQSVEELEAERNAPHADVPGKPS